MAFEPTKFKCKNCQDIIWSRYSGEFRVCKCWIETHEKVHQVTEKLLNKLDAYIEVIGAFDDLQHCISCILMDEFGYGIAVDQTEHYIRQMGSDFDDLFGEDDEQKK